MEYGTNKTGRGLQKLPNWDIDSPAFNIGIAECRPHSTWEKIRKC